MMNRRTWIVMLITVGWVLVQAGVAGLAMAQEATLAHEDVFNKLQRPPVPFDHDIHMDTLSEPGCGACHHEYDDEKGRLIPVEDDGTSCTECHGAKKDGSTPALREAYHGNCTVCHRSMAKSGEKAGPVTCGGCHKKD